jgi:hypothetical protein
MVVGGGVPGLVLWRAALAAWLALREREERARS